MSQIQTVGPLPKSLAKEVQEIERMVDVAALRDMLLRAIGSEVEHVVRISTLVRRLEEMGESLEDFPCSTLLPWYRRVAYGQLMPEVLVQFGQHKALARRTMGLSIPEQRLIVCNGPIKVMEPGGDSRQVPAFDLSPRELKQVFDRDHLRTEAEQMAWIRDQQREAHMSQTGGGDEPEIKLDRRHGRIWIGKRAFSRKQILGWLADLDAGTKVQV